MGPKAVRLQIAIVLLVLAFAIGVVAPASAAGVEDSTAAGNGSLAGDGNLSADHSTDTRRSTAIAANTVSVPDTSTNTTPEADRAAETNDSNDTTASGNGPGRTTEDPVNGVGSGGSRVTPMSDGGPSSTAAAPGQPAAGPPRGELGDAATLRNETVLTSTIQRLPTARLATRLHPGSDGPEPQLHDSDPMGTTTTMAESTPSGLPVGQDVGTAPGLVLAPPNVPLDVGLPGSLGALLGAIAVRTRAVSWDLLASLELFGALGSGLLLVADAGATTVDPLVRLWYPLRYSQYDESDPLEHDKRDHLVETVRNGPGRSLSTVADLTGLPVSTARHHVRVLVAEDLVREASILGCRRLYPAGAKDLELTAALNEDATAAILEALARLDEPCTSAIADAVDRDVSTISYHIERLAAIDLVERDRHGQCTVNRLAPGVEERMDVEPRSLARAEQKPGLRADGNGRPTFDERD